MNAVSRFEFVLLLMAVIAALRLLAPLLRLPPASALILGGCALAFIPGVPEFELDPDLILVLFLPPLLIASAYFTSWRDLKRSLVGVLLLAVGAVVFTTACVAIVVHTMVPVLPWSVCFALGAVVSPPDAVAAKAVLERVSLPRRTMALLEGESLLNDAAGIVLFRFAVAAAMTGSFSVVRAGLTFGTLAVVGVAVGVAAAAICVFVLRRVRDVELAILVTLLLPWLAYIGAERLEGSGVIAAVSAGLVLGWYQHEIVAARTRRTAHSVWEILVSLLEALVFVLIGLSLRGIFSHLGDGALLRLMAPTLGVVAAVVLSRFVWILAVNRLRAVLARVRHRANRGPSFREALVMSWAGMRGVVTLAVALSVPQDMPGRDLILVASFVVILVTVLIQGTTLGPLIALLRPVEVSDGDAWLTREQAAAAVAAAQLKAVQEHAYAPDGTLLHPRLLDQYTVRARVFDEFSRKRTEMTGGRDAHYAVVFAAVAAGRAVALELHRSGRIHDEVLHALEHDLDLQEVTAQRVVGA